jgi:hypothetical protein
VSGPAASRGGYRLDTSVISTRAPGRETRLAPGFDSWLLARGERLFIPSSAVAELEEGICKLRRIGGAQRAGRLTEAVAKGKHPGFADVAIAASHRKAACCC